MKNFFLSPLPLSGPALSVFSLILRLLIGGAMLTHGMAKLMAFHQLFATFADPLGVGSSVSLVMAIGAEVGCSVMVIVGLFMRFAILPLLFTMVMAVFVIHGADPFAIKELAVIYGVVYIALFAVGSGRISLDGLIFRELYKRKYY